jgi:transposase
MPRAIGPLVLSPHQRSELQRWLVALGTPQQVVLRCRIVLAVAAGKTEVETAAENSVNRKRVRLWRERFRSVGLQALWEIASRRGRKPSYAAARIKAVIDATLQTKPKGSTHGSCRTMAAAQGISKSSLSRIWRSYNKPHRTNVQAVTRSEIPREAHRRGRSLSESSRPGNCALRGREEPNSGPATYQPGLPLKKGRCGTMTHDYKRHGTTTLFAALDVLAGKVIGDCYKRHRHQSFCGSCAASIANSPVPVTCRCIW